MVTIIITMIQAYVQEHKMLLTTMLIILSSVLYWARKTLGAVHKPTIRKEGGKWSLVNFGSTQSWEPHDVFRPTSFEQLMEFIKTREKNGIKNVRPIGALHSWSRCCATNGTNIDMTALNKVLDVDQKNLRIRAEAGIVLRDLYREMRKANVAFPVMPNVDVITLGGAVSNGTHGTSIEHGSFSSLVYAIELIDVNGKIWNLTRDSKDPQISKYFDAALISFGSLGVIYSITMQCVEDFNMFNVRSYTELSEVRGNVRKIARKYNSIQFLFQGDKCFLRSSTKVGVEGTRKVAVKHKKFSFVMEIIKDVFWLLHSKGLFSKFCQKLYAIIYREMQCVTWDQYEIFRHTKPFTNMEYSIPDEQIENAVEFILNIFSKTENKRDLFWVIRPVGADDRGFLSATRRDDGKPSFYIDIPYQNKSSEAERKLFMEIEAGLLKLGGRCSFSRLFWNRTPSVLTPFWDKGGAEWKKVKQELDPNHVFTNDFVNSIFFDNKVNL